MITRAGGGGGGGGAEGGKLSEALNHSLWSLTTCMAGVYGFSRACDTQKMGMAHQKLCMLRTHNLPPNKQS